MRFPYDRFLRFLVSRKADVASVLSRLHLPPTGGLYLSDLRSEIRKTAPPMVVRFLDAEETTPLFRDEWMPWARAEGIEALWAAQPEFGSKKHPLLETALRLFGNPTARWVTGMLLMSKATKEESARILSERFSLEVTPDALLFYEPIFWDSSHMGRTAWATFLEGLDKDARHLLSVGLQGPNAAELGHLLGVEPELQPEEVVRNIMREAHFRFKAAMAQPRPEDHEVFRWGELAIKAAEKIGSGGLRMPGAGGQAGTGGLPSGDAPLTGDMESLFQVHVERVPMKKLTDLAGEVSQVRDRAAERAAASKKP